NHASGFHNHLLPRRPTGGASVRRDFTGHAPCGPSPSRELQLTLPRPEARGFPLRKDDVPPPAIQNFPSRIDVTIMQRPALVTLPPPSSSPTFSGGPAGMPPHADRIWELYRAETTVITPPVAIDWYDSTLPSVDQPASPIPFAIQ